MPLTGPTVFPTSQASADRSTFGELKADLARPINPDDENVLAIAGDSIVAALKVYSRFNWPWDVVRQDITLASGTETYALSQPFKTPLSCYFLDGASRPDKRKAYIEYASYLEMYSANADGEPRFYTVENAFETGQVTFYPRPASAYTARLWYYRMTPTRFRTDDTPMEIPGYADEPIRAWAWYEMLKRIGGSANLSRIPSARADAIQARAELVALVTSRGDMIGPS